LPVASEAAGCFHWQPATNNWQLFMSRSAKKGPFVNEKLFRKVTKLNENRAKQPIKTWARACTIIPEFVGHTFEVHNGNKFLRVFVQEDMVGHKLGEFSPTRMFRGHSGKKTGAPA
jgi:small subunit ribosomal protein S19